MQSINSTYIYLNNMILNEGQLAYKDNNAIYEVQGVHLSIDNPLGYNHKVKYELITSHEVLKDIEKGDYNLDGCPIRGDSLYSYIKSFENSDETGFAYTYPNRILSHFGINQFETMVNRLYEDIGTNRSICVTLDPKKDSSEEHIPCLQVIQAIVRNRKLKLHCFFRSNDIFRAYYSNMYFITYIGMRLVEELNKKDVVNSNVVFDGIEYYCSSAHIYNNDQSEARELCAKNKGEYSGWI